MLTLLTDWQFTQGVGGLDHRAETDDLRLGPAKAMAESTNLGNACQGFFVKIPNIRLIADLA